MADHKEFHSLDELFRKTFDDLPASAAPSGWDTPSDRVWEQVQVGITTRHNGWNSAQRWLAMAAITVSVAVGLYLLTNNANTNNTQQAQPVTGNNTIAAPSQPTATIEVAPTTASLPTTAPQQQKKASNAVNHRQLEANLPLKTPIAAPATPVTAPVIPKPAQVATASGKEEPFLNSTERAKRRAQKEAARWRTPVAVLPLTRKNNDERTVLDALKKLGQ